MKHLDTMADNLSFIFNRTIVKNKLHSLQCFVRMTVSTSQYICHQSDVHSNHWSSHQSHFS